MNRRTSPIGGLRYSAARILTFLAVVSILNAGCALTPSEAQLGTAPSPSGEPRITGAAVRAAVDSVLGSGVFQWTPSGSMEDGSPVVVGRENSRSDTPGIKLSGLDDDLQIVELYDKPLAPGEAPSELARAIVRAVVPEAEAWVQSQTLSTPQVKSFGGFYFLWARETYLDGVAYSVLAISATPIPSGK